MDKLENKPAVIIATPVFVFLSQYYIKFDTQLHTQAGVLT